MDLLRSAYRTESWLPSVGAWVPIRWYFLDEVPGAWQATLFPSANWDDTHDFWPGYGEWSYRSPKWANGAPPPWPSAATFGVATLDLVADGVRALEAARTGEATLDLVADGVRNLRAARTGEATLDLVADGVRNLNATQAGEATLKLLADGARHLQTSRAGESSLKLIADGVSVLTTDFDRGFDFRLAGSAITDPSNCQMATPSDAYPTTRNGVTFGWVSSLTVQGITRTLTNDPRICGMNRNLTSTAGTFKVDLPTTGTYRITLAWGDPGVTMTNAVIAFSDSALSLFSYGPASNAIGEMRDANNVVRTTATWPASNTTRTVTMTTTQLRVSLSGSPMTAQSAISHLRITKV